jgi:hypothetical protein
MEEYFQSTAGSDKDVREERQLQVCPQREDVDDLICGRTSNARAFEGGERFDVAPSR